MSHNLDLAVAFPARPVIFGVLAIIIVALLILTLVHRSRRKQHVLTSWDAAADELGIQFVPNGSNLGPVARGQVNDHVVSISPMVNGKKKQRVTRYSVQFEALEAPEFNLVRRISDKRPIIDTGNPKFDAVVSIRTEQPELLRDFLTASRRAAILRLLTYFPAAQVTNREAHLLTRGIEEQKDQLVDSICHLVATAEIFDRVTDGDDEPSPDGGGAVTTSAGQQPANGEHDLLTGIHLDEVSVLDALFNSDLDDAAVATLFEQSYQSREVSWTGEVLSVRLTDTGIQRVVAFVGSADGMSTKSGRVVAMTSLKPEPSVVSGDVVSVSGSLANLDLAQRLFHVV